MERVWRVLDQDKDGKLNFNEARYLVALNFNINPEKVSDKDITEGAGGVIPKNMTRATFMDIFASPLRRRSQKRVQGMLDQLAAWGRMAPEIESATAQGHGNADAASMAKKKKLKQSASNATSKFMDKMEKKTIKTQIKNTKNNNNKNAIYSNCRFNKPRNGYRQCYISTN